MIDTAPIMTHRFISPRDLCVERLISGGGKGLGDGKEIDQVD